MCPPPALFLLQEPVTGSLKRPRSRPQEKQIARGTHQSHCDGFSVEVRIALTDFSLSSIRWIRASVRIRGRQDM